MLIGCATVAAADGAPDELAGGLQALRSAWQLTGVTPSATVMGYDSERGPALLVAGPRAASEPARLGDLTLVSPDGHARRRLVAETGLVGWPALVGQAAVACEQAGTLTVWTLSRSGLENTPRRITTAQPGTLGPVCLGRTALFATGSRVNAVGDLLDERWHADLPSAVAVPLATDSERAFAADAAGLTALSLTGGQRAWRTALPAAPRTALVVAEGLVIAGLSDGSVRAWDVDDGSEQWRRDVDAPADFALMPAVAGPWLFLTLADGRMLGLEVGSGELRWSAHRAGPLSSPVVGRGHVFVTTGDGLIAAVSIADPTQGRTAAAIDADGRPVRLTSVPCLLGDRLYAVSDEGLLVAYDLVGASGAVDWPLPGGTAQRVGHSLPADALPPALDPQPGPAPEDDLDTP